MSLLNDRQICDYAANGMIAPFEASLVKEGMSRGLSSFGYDLTLGRKFKRYLPSMHPLDPHAVTEMDVEEFETDTLIIEAGECVLGVTVETLKLPRNITGKICDKSTAARCFVTVQNTVIEAGFEGTITLELVNHLHRPVILRAGGGICQVLFLTGHNCGVSYADRRGKYNFQGSSPVLPRAL